MDVAGPGGDRLLDFDGAMERLSAWKGRIDKLATDTRAMSDGLERRRRVCGSGEKPGTAITVDTL